MKWNLNTEIKKQNKWIGIDVKSMIHMIVLKRRSHFTSVIHIYFHWIL